MSTICAHDPQLERLEVAIAQRVGQERYSVWFTNSTKLDLKEDELEIAVPNDFISEWILRNFAKTIQDAAHEVLGCRTIRRVGLAAYERRVPNRGDMGTRRGRFGKKGQTEGAGNPRDSDKSRRVGRSL